MIEPIPWTQREFTFDQPTGVFPAIVERLRGTPARAKELLAGVPEEVLGNPVNGKWSVKQHIGHLVDLEALDAKRLSEFLDRLSVLSPADIGNRATEDANHGQTPIREIIRRLRVGRTVLISRLEQLANDDVSIVAIHPRLQRPVRLLDWAYFVAEHDDHHLAHAARVVRNLG